MSCVSILGLHPLKAAFRGQMHHSIQGRPILKAPFNAEYGLGMRPSFLCHEEYNPLLNPLWPTVSQHLLHSDDSWICTP